MTPNRKSGWTGEHTQSHGIYRCVLAPERKSRTLEEMVEKAALWLKGRVLLVPLYLWDHDGTERHKEKPHAG